MYRSCFFIVLWFLPLFSYSQIKNLQAFHRNNFHFGFGLGYNSSSLNLVRNPNYSDSLMVLEVAKKPGLNITVVSSLNISKNVSLRFTPTFLFKERNLEYSFQTIKRQEGYWEKPVRSAYYDFPLLLKLETNRIDNFSAFAVGGAYLSVDLSSDRKVQNPTHSYKDIIIKTELLDYGVEVGGGVEFYLEYFRYGLELKLSSGMRDILIQDQTAFSAPIESLRNKVWMLTMYFEGGKGVRNRKK